jgi:hypothetical protein
MRYGGAGAARRRRAAVTVGENITGERLIHDDVVGVYDLPRL